MIDLQPEALARDSVNVKLLTALANNPRMTTADLARVVGMSSPAVRERVQRLEEAGVISGYRLELDPKCLGYPVEAFVRVRPIPGKMPKIIEAARKTPNVVECYRITGEDCFLMRVHVESIDMLGEVLDAFLSYGQTTSSIVQSTTVPRRALPLMTA
jgi:Lrp/AsnC family leucine-responsive transcriptional regulator